MPAKSKAARRVAAVTRQVKEGYMRLADVPLGMRDDVKSMMGMRLDQLADFAETKEKNIPQHAKKRKKRA